MERNREFLVSGRTGSWCTGLSAKTNIAKARVSGEWISLEWLWALSSRCDLRFSWIGWGDWAAIDEMVTGTYSGVLSSADPDLLVLQFGGNESAYSNMTETKYEKDFRALLEKCARWHPNQLFGVSPLDQGERKRGRIQTVRF